MGILCNRRIPDGRERWGPIIVYHSDQRALLQVDTPPERVQKRSVQVQQGEQLLYLVVFPQILPAHLTLILPQIHIISSDSFN